MAIPSPVNGVIHQKRKQKWVSRWTRWFGPKMKAQVTNQGSCTPSSIELIRGQIRNSGNLVLYLAVVYFLFPSVWKSFSFFSWPSSSWHFWRLQTSYSVECPLVWIYLIIPHDYIQDMHLWQKYQTSDTVLLITSYQMVQISISHITDNKLISWLR